MAETALTEDLVSDISLDSLAPSLESEVKPTVSDLDTSEFDLSGMDAEIKTSEVEDAPELTAEQLTSVEQSQVVSSDNFEELAEDLPPAQDNSSDEDDITGPYWSFDSKSLIEKLNPIMTFYKDGTLEAFRMVCLESVQGGVRFRINMEDYRYEFTLKVNNSDKELIKEPKYIFIKQLLNVARFGTRTIILPSSDGSSLCAKTLSGLVELDFSNNIQAEHFSDAQFPHSKSDLDFQPLNVETFKIFSRKSEQSMSLAQGDTNKSVSVKKMSDGFGEGVSSFGSSVYAIFHTAPEHDFAFLKSDLSILARAVAKADSISYVFYNKGAGFYVFSIKNGDRYDYLYMAGRVDQGAESARETLKKYEAKVSFNIAPDNFHRILSFCKAITGDSCQITLYIKDSFLYAKSFTPGKKVMEFKLCSAGKIDKFSMTHNVVRLLSIVNLIKDDKAARIIIDTNGWLRFITTDIQIILGREV